MGGIEIETNAGKHGAQGIGTRDPGGMGGSGGEAASGLPLVRARMGTGESIQITRAGDAPLRRHGVRSGAGWGGGGRASMGTDEPPHDEEDCDHAGDEVSGLEARALENASIEEIH